MERRIWQRIGARYGPRSGDKPPKVVSAPTQKEIRLAAYYLWEKAGRPANDGLQHWLAAERYLKWEDDRGDFVSSILCCKDEEYQYLEPDPIFRLALRTRTYQTFTLSVGEIVHRRGRWEKRKDGISFYYYGPGYYDHECTKIAHPAEEFEGVD